ncbi:14368_t:CDS:1, partial [Racocetra persica]
MAKAQDYVENNFPKDSKVINAANKNLVGSLDLRKYSNLEELNIRENQITNLIFSD